MVNSYSRKQFQNDLKKLAKLIKDFPKSNQSGGKRNKNGQLVKMRTFEVVEVDGKEVKPHGNYQIKEASKVGPEVAASKAAKQLCRKIKRNGGSHTDCEGRTLVIREKTSGSAHKHFGPYSVVVDQLTPAQSKTRTQGLIKGLTARLMKTKGMSEAAAKKKAEKDTKKITHKVSAKIIRK
jgi:hypothetical protein